jgi:HNH endonuclease
VKALAARLSIERRGAGNPAWKGLDTEGSIYRVFNTRLKGESCCRNCGASGLLHLHHIVPRSMCKAARRDLRNGLPLCVACHNRWHARTGTIYRDILTPAEWDYVSSLELTGQNIAAWLDARYPCRSAQEAA